jgi:hypothetical protein
MDRETTKDIISTKKEIIPFYITINVPYFC